MTPTETKDRGALDRALRSYLALSKRVVLVVGLGTLALMVAMNGLEIVGRGLFGRSFNWVQELSIITAMWVYFFAYALIAKDQEYIRVDIVANALSEASRRRVTIFSRLVTIAFHATVLWFSVETFRFLGLFTTAVLDWPESLFVVPILLGAADILATELIYLWWTLTGRPLPRARHVVQEAD